MVEQDKVLVSWVAKSRPFQKNPGQSRQVIFVLGGLISMVLVFAGEWMLLAVLAAGAFYYFATSKIAPEDMEYKITNKGIVAFGRTFMWWEFARWWWTEKWDTQLIGLDLQSGVMGRMYIPIEEKRKDEIEKSLNEFLLFEKPTDTTIDKFSKWVAEKFPLENKI
jgi:hypothetical protein